MGKGARSGRDRGGDRSRVGSQSAPDALDAAVDALELAAADRARGNQQSAVLCARELANGPSSEHARLVDRAAARLLISRVSSLWPLGWLPEDVYQMARRNVSEAASSLVVDVIAEELHRYPAATTHQTWFDHLTRIQAHRWWDAGRPHLSQWADRLGLDRFTALLTAIELAALSFTMPRLPAILPLPGQAPAAAGATSAGDVDKGILSKVRSLLAKAESTAFPDEAEALSAKAQELMSRYAIHRAMLDSEDQTPPLAAARRVWLDNPYLGAKALLVANVAAANRCRAVSHEKLGFVVVLGDEVDLDTVELLTTSLMLQATKAMLMAGTQVPRGGQSRTRSFRQSFLVAYATRIGERLREAAESSIAAAGRELVPVFTARKQAVDDLLGTLYPKTATRSYTVGNAAGWGAGRAAADRARLHPERSVLDRG